MSAASRVPADWAAPARAPVEGILGAIGDTPLVALRRLLLRPDVHVWAKLEASNPGGSAKDRPAARMLEDALERGLVDLGTTVIESSSGNMGIGLAQACRYHGMRLIVVVDARAHASSVRAMRALGADVRVIEHPDPATGDLLVARMSAVQRLLAQIPNSFWPDQYANESNPAAHAAGTMREIDDALGGRHRPRLRRHEHDGHTAWLCRVPARAGAQYAHRGRGLHRQRALRRSPRHAPDARLRGGGRDEPLRGGRIR